MSPVSPLILSYNNTVQLRWREFSDFYNHARSSWLTLYTINACFNKLSILNRHDWTNLPCKIAANCLEAYNSRPCPCRSWQCDWVGFECQRSCRDRAAKNGPHCQSLVIAHSLSVTFTLIFFAIIISINIAWYNPLAGKSMSTKRCSLYKI